MLWVFFFHVTSGMKMWWRLFWLSSDTWMLRGLCLWWNLRTLWRSDSSEFTRKRETSIKPKKTSSIHIKLRQMFSSHGLNWPWKWFFSIFVTRQLLSAGLDRRRQLGDIEFSNKYAEFLRSKAKHSSICAFLRRMQGVRMRCETWTLHTGTVQHCAIQQQCTVQF